MGQLTVVVATRNRRERLLETLPRHEAPVVVVDNGSTDGTAEAVIRAFPGARVIRLSDNLGAAARTVGVRAAGTPYVAFADDDSYWEPGALHRAGHLLDTYPRAGLLAARVLVGPDGRLDPVSALMAAAPMGTSPALPGPSILGFLGCAAVVRTTAYLDAGGFPPRLGVYGEENLLALDLAAAGWGLAYVPDLVVRHLPEPAGRVPAARRRQERRNDLLTAWLRRSAASAAARTVAALSDADGRAAVCAAARHLPWALRQRRRLPAGVEAAARVLESTGG